MAESRRVHLTTLAPRFPSAAGQGETRPDRPADADADADTVRLVVALFEPDERSFPEFSYSQLVDRKLKGAKDEVLPSRLEEEEEEEVEVERRREQDEAAALAKKLEEKYGGRAKKSDRIQDLIDIGYGYDEDDSFIDNSEAYDEFVPASLTTKFGGFYVNSGVLQFRLTSDPEEAQTSHLTRKRKLNPGQEKPKKKVCRDDGGTETDEDPRDSEVRKKKKKKKKRRSVGPLSVTSMLKKFQREKEEWQKVALATPTIPLGPADAAGGGASGLTDPLLSLIGSTNDHALIQAASAVDFDIDLDSLLEASEGAAAAAAQPATDLLHFLPKTDDLTEAPPPDVHPPPSDQTSATCPNQYPCLPDGVPPGLAAAIEKLAAAAKTSEGESKLKFFTPEINSILLDIELQCREHGGQLRSKVYTHLSSFLPCSRDTVLKRVKKLLLAHAVHAVPHVQAAGGGVPAPTPEPWSSSKEEPLHRLKEAIRGAMPEQIARYHDTCRAYEQLRSSRAAEEEKDPTQKMSPPAEDNLEERGGKRGGPKKTFRWTEDVREHLAQVLRVNLEKNQEEKVGLDLEELLKTLLDTEVKPLWPKGWMQSRVLMRESRKVLGLRPSLPVKKKQPVGVDDAGVPRGSCPSLLNLLADQALARERPPPASQHLLAAAVAKYRPSARRWSLGPDAGSPPQPPPPPQSSPAEFPVSGTYHLLTMGDFARHVGAGQSPDGADVTIQ